MAAGEVLNALPAILHNTSVDRHEADARIAANTTWLHCRRLVEPGWIDPDVLDYTLSCSVSHCADLKKYICFKSCSPMYTSPARS